MVLCYDGPNEGSQVKSLGREEKVGCQDGGVVPMFGLGWHGTGKRSLIPAPAWPQVRPTTQGFQQVLLRGLWVVPQQRIQGHHHPRGAEAALGPVALGNPLLEGHRRGHRP